MSECELTVRMTHLCKYLKVLHKRGWIHCDLKPDHIIITKQGLLPRCKEKTESTSSGVSGLRKGQRAASSVLRPKTPEHVPFRPFLTPKSSEAFPRVFVIGLNQATQVGRKFVGNGTLEYWPIERTFGINKATIGTDIFGAAMCLVSWISGPNNRIPLSLGTRRGELVWRLFHDSNVDPFDALDTPINLRNDNLLTCLREMTILPDKQRRFPKMFIGQSEVN